ncbi:centriolar satellite-associated tubulin polyglutamylase complex regulator 1-like isoform X2 [Rhopilema esculentum]|uniref:centriolar satellite-associated tubulin polyglutamylase complex regulator 1-like isoform X2 n=1 Tax=Rhopilema esculentum TaxID=499914 RepID=UPI0031DCA95A
MGSNNNPEFSLTAEEYLEKHHIAVYFEDAITQLLEYSEENIKVNPAKFFHDYFTSVKRGEHTLLRDYSFIISTPHNRSSFIRSFWKCFRPIGNNGGLLNVKEYHSLVCLMCPDFPFDVLQKTARSTKSDQEATFKHNKLSKLDKISFLVHCSVWKDLVSSPVSSFDLYIEPFINFNFCNLLYRSLSKVSVRHCLMSFIINFISSQIPKSLFDSHNILSQLIILPITKLQEKGEMLRYITTILSIC